MDTIILGVKQTKQKDIDQANKQQVSVFYRQRGVHVDGTANKAATMESVTKELGERNIDIVLNETLKGGSVSQVFAGELETGEKVVVKHTNDLTPYDPTEIFISREGHNTDSEILKYLKEHELNVPDIIAHFPEISTTVMKDVRSDGYKLLQFSIEEGKLPMQNAFSIGKDLAEIVSKLVDFEGFLNETAEESFYERAFELRVFYPNNPQHFEDLHKEFCAKSKKVIPPDTHPKNIFVKEDGTNMFIDFGRSHFGDERYVLPNFLAHIVIYTLLGNIEKDIAVAFFKKCIEGYASVSPINNEELFCKYLAMEVAHRFAGKRVGGNFDSEAKQKLLAFATKVLDDNIGSISEVIALLDS